jgi:urease accessory protein
MSLVPAASATPSQDGWQARLDLGFEHRAGRTVLARRRRLGPLAVQRSFHPEGDLCHVYLLHPPGGVVGGDRLDVSVELASDSAAVITAPGAAKFYRSAGPSAALRQQLQVGDGASLEWLPHENIVFDGARLRAHTRVELAAGARFIGWEMHCLGRPASRAPFVAGEATVRFDVLRAGRPLLLERLRLTAEHLHRPARLRDNAVIATLLAIPADTCLRDALRNAVGQDTARHDDAVQGAVTLLDDLLVLRAIGPSTEQIRRRLVTAWGVLRPQVIGRPACPPRIWAT